MTNDGSTTIHLPEWNESYHSKHGAIQEAYHVFIKNGFLLFEGHELLQTGETKPISILEIGFGTGLNAFITFVEALKSNQVINYVGVEAYPVSIEEAMQMNYISQMAENQSDIFKSLHHLAWEEEHQLTAHFSFTKRQQFFQDITDTNTFDLIYFDAFGFRVQPELWSDLIFQKMYASLRSNGILVTYACRTSIKNAMLLAGFSVEKLPGAPGKREMLRATKGLSKI